MTKSRDGLEPAPDIWTHTCTLVLMALGFSCETHTHAAMRSFSALMRGDQVNPRDNGAKTSRYHCGMDTPMHMDVPHQEIARTIMAKMSVQSMDLRESSELRHTLAHQTKNIHTTIPVYTRCSHIGAAWLSKRILMCCESD